MITDLKKIYYSTGYALKGLRHAYIGDKSFRMEVNYGLPIYLVIIWVLSPLAPLDAALLIFSYLLILLVELVNTAFEKMLERLHPERHELIGKSKDIAAAAVFIAFVFAFIVVTLLLYQHILLHGVFSFGGRFV